MANKLLWITIPASLLIAGAGLFLATYQPPAISKQTNMATTPRHPVTVDMSKDASAKSGRAAPDFTLPDTDGKPISLKTLLAKGPVVVVMTKDGCPCSIESQPFFNAISKSYAGKASFVGIIDADRPTASLYQSSLSVPYPIVSETAGTTFRRYQAEQSVYTYLIAKSGDILRVWPGYNKAMMVELNSLVAQAAGAPMQGLDVNKAPDEMTSGCYFFRPDENVKAQQRG